MKRMIGIILVSIMAFSVTMTSFAQGETDLIQEKIAVQALYADPNGVETPLEIQYETMPVPSDRSGVEQGCIQATAVVFLKNQNPRNYDIADGNSHGDLPAVKGSIKIYYDKLGSRQYKITQVTGSWTPVSNSIPMKNRYVEVLGDGCVLTRFPMGNTYRFDTGFKAAPPTFPKVYALSHVEGLSGTAPSNWGKLEIKVSPQI